ncbi:MAG: SusE domain-containing protein [Chitinophagaceae bacterium]
MKTIAKWLLLTVLSGVVFQSCKKDENQIFAVSGTAPVLSASSTASMVLAIAQKASPAITFSWTNPNYYFTTGLSSQDVTYTLQFDTTGSNFTNPNIQEKAIAKDLGASLTVGELNTILAKVGIQENKPAKVEVRVKSSIGTNLPLYSNVLKLTITTYLDVAVPLPTTGGLYLVGDATAGGWNNPVPTPSQQFTKVSNTFYEITVPLVGGKEYLVLPLNGDWAHKYAVPNKTVAGLSAGGDFKFDANDNFPGPAVSGNYKIQLDFKLGTFKVTKL